MQITFNIPEFTRNDVSHITTISRQTRSGWRDRSDSDVAIKAC